MSAGENCADVPKKGEKREVPGLKVSGATVLVEQPTRASLVSQSFQYISQIMGIGIILA